MLLNCDMGEGLDNDAELMPYLDQANVACGGHAGDDESMEHCVSLALQHGVSIGAHIAYEDQQHFGRKRYDLSESELIDIACWQIEVLLAKCKQAGTTLDYVKPHGALYNQMMEQEAVLSALLQACSMYDDLHFMLMAVNNRTRQHDIADRLGIRLTHEAFADRAYTAKGLLQPRNEEGASLASLEQIQQQARELIHNQRVAVADGSFIAVEAETICVHGDHPLAIDAAKALRKLIDDADSSA